MSTPVLLVEDNTDDVHFMERAFARAEVTRPLRALSDGQQAIDYLAGLGQYADRSAHPLPGHLILDIKLPLRSGLEVLEWLRQDVALRNLPAIILTSSTEKSDRQRARELGAQAYLVKPVNFSSLVGIARAIGEWLDTGRTAQFERAAPL